MFTCTQVERHVERGALIGLNGKGPRHFCQECDSAVPAVHTSAMAAPQSSADAAVSAKDAIPTAIFIEDIESYMKREGTAEAALEKLQRLYSAFKFMEQRLTQKKTKLKIKLPEITKTYQSLLQMEEQSKLGEALVSHYELASTGSAPAGATYNDDLVVPWDALRGVLEHIIARAA